MFPEVENGIVAAVRAVLHKKGWIDLPAQGTSMYPLIKEGDICRFTTSHLSVLNKGDIILFFIPYHGLVAHRYVGKDGMRYVCKGDANLALDPPIEQHSILGKLSFIERQENKIQLDNFLVKGWGQLVQAVPIVSTLIRLFLTYKTSA